MPAFLKSLLNRRTRKSAKNWGTGSAVPALNTDISLPHPLYAMQYDHLADFTGGNNAEIRNSIYGVE